MLMWLFDFYIFKGNNLYNTPLHNIQSSFSDKIYSKFLLKTSFFYLTLTYYFFPVLLNIQFISLYK